MIYCGDILYGELSSPSDYDVYGFELLNDSEVLFDLCQSSYDTHLFLYGYNFTLLYQNDDGCLGDSVQSKLSIQYLPTGRYLLIIDGYGTGFHHDYGEWKIEVACQATGSSYKLITDVDKSQWFLGAIECRDRYGTSLATVITDEDVADVLQLFAKNDVDTTQDFKVWIGLYRDAVNGSQWLWSTGTSCDYAESGKCIDDKHWDDNKPDISDNFQGGAYLQVSVDDTVSFFDERMGVTADGILCNAPKPNGVYSAANCTKQFNCWMNIDSINDSIIMSDFDWTMPVIFWQSELCLIGLKYVHCTMGFTISHTNYQWNHLEYNHPKLDIFFLTKHYYRYEDSLYLYIWNYTAIELQGVLMHINLTNIAVKVEKIPSELSYWTEYVFAQGFDLDVVDITGYVCMVATATHVYLVTIGHILIYTISSNLWRISRYEVDLVSTCTLSNDQKFIYIFGTSFGSFNKYDISTATFEAVDAFNLCQYNYAAGITARNNKMYLAGCHVADSWKTLIFNTKTVEFEEQTLDIDYPLQQFIPDYTMGLTVVMDDNVLLMTHPTDPTRPSFNSIPISRMIRLYYAITDLISINFKDTETNIEIWPTDGFAIKYFVNDFSDSAHNVYYMKVYSNDTAKIVNTFIQLNTSTDNCICTDYKCYDCAQYFDLKTHLSIMDNDIHQLNISLMPSEVETNITLILPEYVQINLQRCNIHFITSTHKVTNNDLLIRFAYNMSSNCYSRIGTNYSVNITAVSVNISKELIVSMVDNATKICRMCRRERNYDNEDCIDCSDGTFDLQPIIREQDDTKFEVLMESNMIDLRVISSQHTLQYLTTPSKIDLRSNLYLLLLLIIPCIIILIVSVYCRRQYKSAFIVDKALVLVIGISQFDNKKAYLPGVKQNVEDLVDLWRYQYNYHVFVCNYDTLYCTKRDVIKFIDYHTSKLVEETYIYDSVIVHVISHGSDDLFVASDGKIIKTDFIQHELITAATETQRLALIKLIFHHGCRGKNDYRPPNKKSKIRQHQSRGLFNISHNTIINNTSDETISHDSNCVIISGNIKGRALSDSGNFTKCICDAFGTNLKKIIKTDFNALIVEIGRNLEQKTEHAELCNINGTLRYDPIRFEQCKDKMEQKHEKYAELEQKINPDPDVNKETNVVTNITLAVTETFCDTANDNDSVESNCVIDDVSDSNGKDVINGVEMTSIIIKGGNDIKGEGIDALMDELEIEWENNEDSVKL